MKVSTNLFKDKFGNYSIGKQKPDGEWANITLYKANPQGEPYMTKDGKTYLRITIDESIIPVLKQEQENFQQSTPRPENNPKIEKSNDEDLIDPNDLPF